MRRRMAAVGSPRLAAPILRAARCWIIVPFPPHRSIRAQRDVGEDRIMLNRRHGIRIGLGTGTRSNAEKPSFGINRPEPTVGTDPKPRNIIADGMNFPALHARWRHQHGEVGLAARAWKRTTNVMGIAFGVFHAHNQHMLGKPALFLPKLARNPQSEAFLR